MPGRGLVVPCPAFPSWRTTTDSTDHGRAEFIAGLRALADFLAAHPEIPVPIQAISAEITVHALQGGDAEQAQLCRPDRRGARQARHRHNGHYGTWRAFGPVSFGALAISGAHMTAHAVQMSYYRHVTPAAESVPDAPAA